MSYDDPTHEKCSICEKRVELNLMEHEVRNGEALHTECAKAWDEEMGEADAEAHANHGSEK